MTTIRLTGLDGSNPLAFLAALGVLVALDDVRGSADRPRLAWTFDGRWVPEITSRCRDLESLGGALDADRRAVATDPALHFAYAKGDKWIEDVKPQPEDLHRQLEAWATEATPAARRTLDWFTAFVSEGAIDRSGAAKPTALHFTAGQQRFLRAAKELAEGTTAADLRAALEGPWPYDNKLPVMGWDNTETRDYALRATDPAREKKLGNPGADWLALRGLVLLPTAARGQRQQTPGVRGGWKSGTFAWPMWTPPVTRDEVRGLLLMNALRTLDPPRLGRRGIARVFEVRILRSDQGGYGSVTPARPR